MSFSQNLKHFVTNVMSHIKLVVFFDLLAVALVVPLIPSIFKELGISSEKYGVVSSVYSASQVLGGLVLGVLSDHGLGRRGVLIISFVGSAISYMLLGITTSLQVLILSRVLVGLVKQTMTISTALVADYSSPESRARELGQLSAATTFAFIVGPSLGGMLFKRNKAYPGLVAAMLFLIDSAIVIFVLPPSKSKRSEELKRASMGEDTPPPSTELSKGKDAPRSTANTEERREEAGEKQTVAKFFINFQKTCLNPVCLRLIAVKLFFGFLFRAMTSASFGYYEDRWGVETHNLGYLSSLRAVLSLICQVWVVGFLVKKCGGEGWVIYLGGLGLVLANFLEALDITLNMYLVALLPSKILASTLLTVSLQSLFTKAIPAKEAGSALGTLNVLSSGVGVIAPLYGGKVFGGVDLQYRSLVIGAHYLIFVIMWYTLCSRYIQAPSIESMEAESSKKKVE